MKNYNKKINKKINNINKKNLNKKINNNKKDINKKENEDENKKDIIKQTFYNLLDFKIFILNNNLNENDNYKNNNKYYDLILDINDNERYILNYKEMILKYNIINLNKLCFNGSLTIYINSFYISELNIFKNIIKSIEGDIDIDTLKIIDTREEKISFYNNTSLENLHIKLNTSINKLIIKRQTKKENEKAKCNIYLEGNYFNLTNINISNTKYNKLYLKKANYNEILINDKLKISNLNNINYVKLKNLTLDNYSLLEQININKNDNIINGNIYSNLKTIIIKDNTNLELKGNFNNSLSILGNINKLILNGTFKGFENINCNNLIIKKFDNIDNLIQNNIIVNNNIIFNNIKNKNTINKSKVLFDNKNNKKYSLILNNSIFNINFLNLFSNIIRINNNKNIIELIGNFKDYLFDLSYFNDFIDKYKYYKIKIFGNFKGNNYINIENNTIDYINGNFENIILNIKSIINLYGNYETLYIQNCKNEYYKNLNLNIKELFFNNCNIKILSDNIFNIEKLKLINCNNIKEINNKFINIKYLYLKNCNNIINIPNTFYNLEYINISKCKNLKISINDIKLYKKLKLNNCKGKVFDVLKNNLNIPIFLLYSLIK